MVYTRFLLILNSYDISFEVVNKYNNVLANNGGHNFFLSIPAMSNQH